MAHVKLFAGGAVGNRKEVCPSPHSLNFLTENVSNICKTEKQASMLTAPFQQSPPHSQSSLLMPPPHSTQLPFDFEANADAHINLNISECTSLKNKTLSNQNYNITITLRTLNSDS